MRGRAFLYGVCDTLAVKKSGLVLGFQNDVFSAPVSVWGFCFCIGFRPLVIVCICLFQSTMCTARRHFTARSHRSTRSTIWSWYYLTLSHLMCSTYRNGIEWIQHVFNVRHPLRWRLHDMWSLGRQISILGPVIILSIARRQKFHQRGTERRFPHVLPVPSG